jgi:hypothetical protein
MPVEASGFEFCNGSQGDRFLFHYTSTSGLAGILDSGVFRLSSLDGLNDPRDSRPFSFAFRLSQSDVDSGVKLTHKVDVAMNLRCNEILRSKAYVGCFTREVPGGTGAGYFDRGFTRGRNWHQYADQHRGACLVFDRAKLVAATAAVLARPPSEIDPSLMDDTFHHAPVDYQNRSRLDVDDESASPMIEFSRIADIDNLAAEFKKQYWYPFFFRKHLDWQSELEYRLLVWSDHGAPLIPIKDAMVAIVIGEQMPRWEISVLSFRLYRMGVSLLHVAQMVWSSGDPGAYLPEEIEGFEFVAVDPYSPHPYPVRPLKPEEYVGIPVAPTGRRLTYPNGPAK